MDIIKNIFQRKALVPENLLSYGFTQNTDAYSYCTILPDSGFEIKIQVTKQGEVSSTVMDPDSNEPYTLHLVDDAVGSFVGAVRSEYEQILCEIAEACFTPDVFKSVQTKELIAYVCSKYGDEPEYLWEKSPDSAVWRRKDTGKWYGLLMTISTGKLGVVPGEMAEILDLRMEPEKLSKLVDGKVYFPGWHMNKRSWYTMILDGSVPLEELCDRIDESYMLAVK